MCHVPRVTFAFECGVETVIFQPRAVCAVASVWLRLDQAADPVGSLWTQRLAKMFVERRHGSDRVCDQIEVMNVKDRLREALLPSRGNHQLRRGQPTVAVLAADLGPVDAARERLPQGLGQPRHRQQNGKRVTVHEHQAGVRIDGPYRREGEDVVGTFQDPAAARRLVLEVLQKTLVKAVGVEVSDFSSQRR